MVLVVCFPMNMQKIIAFGIGTIFLGIAAVIAFVVVLNAQLPQMISLEDYIDATPQVSKVYGRNGEQIGEFYREKRNLTELEEIPEVVRKAFLAAEDSSFYEHSGINYVGIMRAIIANIKAGRKVQGASTITQQVARSILLTREKTYTRKIKEVLLSFKMESTLTKDQILYLYLNHIFLGQQAYGVTVAADVYFKKPIGEVNVKEAAILAGLPKAPSAYSPLRNPSRAKERQLYVLSRMADEGYITQEQADAAGQEPLNVYKRRTYWDKAPHFLETVRQMLINELGDETVHDKGLRIYTSLDLEKQTAAQEYIQVGLRELDKRQGYRGPLGNIQDPAEIAEFLLKERNRLLEEKHPFRVLQPDGTISEWGPLNLTGFEPELEEKPDDYEPVKLPTLPDYIEPGAYTKGVVTKIDDTWGLVYVRFAETKGLIDISTMGWARVPDPEKNVKWLEPIEKPSEVLKIGDIIELQVMSKKFYSTKIAERLKDLKKDMGKKYERPAELPDYEEYSEVALEQIPLAQGALLAFDQRTDDIISMVGGYEFSSKNQLNRSIQAVRQTGSAFKPFVYLAALDKGYNPASLILDAPIVYEEEQEVVGNDDSEAIIKKWKPTNHSNKFRGDILFRNALIQSLNVPSVKIIEKIGVSWAADYAKRLGVFSPLNMDFTLALGSSSVTLYEMVKAFSQIGKMGEATIPLFIHKVEDKHGNIIMEKVSLDKRFEDSIRNYEEYFRRRRLNYLAFKKSMENGSEFKPVFPYRVAKKSAEEKAEGAAEEAANEQAAELLADIATISPSPAPTEAPQLDEDGKEKFVFNLPQLPDPKKEPPFFEGNTRQLVKPETAYVLTSLLKGVVDEEGGTGRRAAALGRPVAGKTGSTSNYYDAWFLGYTADIAAGVWVGYDEEKSLGKGEVGGRSALPIWVEYMKAAHGESPARDFPVPDGIVFASIDNETGRLASATSKEVVRQAFAEGTEPKDVQDDPSSEANTETIDFFKEDLAE